MAKKNAKLGKTLEDGRRVIAIGIGVSINEDPEYLDDDILIVYPIRMLTDPNAESEEREFQIEKTELGDNGWKDNDAIKEIGSGGSITDAIDKANGRQTATKKRLLLWTNYRDGVSDVKGKTKRAEFRDSLNKRNDIVQYARYLNEIAGSLEEKLEALQDEAHAEENSETQNDEHEEYWEDYEQELMIRELNQEAAVLEEEYWEYWEERSRQRYEAYC